MNDSTEWILVKIIAWGLALICTILIACVLKWALSKLFDR